MIALVAFVSPSYQSRFHLLELKFSESDLISGNNIHPDMLAILADMGKVEASQLEQLDCIDKRIKPDPRYFNLNHIIVDQNDTEFFGWSLRLKSGDFDSFMKNIEQSNPEYVNEIFHSALQSGLQLVSTLAASAATVADEESSKPKSNLASQSVFKTPTGTPTVATAANPAAAVTSQAPQPK